MAKLRIVAVRVGEEPRVEEIEEGLASMQKLVGGLIDMQGVTDGIDVVYNDDGVALGLPENGCGLLGNFFFVGANNEGESVSLSDAQCEMMLAHAVAYRGERHPGGKVEFHSFDSFEEMEEFRRNRAFGEEHRN